MTFEVGQDSSFFVQNSPCNKSSNTTWHKFKQADRIQVAKCQRKLMPLKQKQVGLQQLTTVNSVNELCN